MDKGIFLKTTVSNLCPTTAAAVVSIYAHQQRHQSLLLQWELTSLPLCLSNPQIPLIENRSGIPSEKSNRKHAAPSGLRGGCAAFLLSGASTASVAKLAEAARSDG